MHLRSHSKLNRTDLLNMPLDMLLEIGSHMSIQDFIIFKQICTKTAEIGLYSGSNYSNVPEVFQDLYSSGRKEADMTLVNILRKNGKNKILKDFDWGIKKVKKHSLGAPPLPLYKFEKLDNILIDLNALNQKKLDSILFNAAHNGEIIFAQLLIDNGANVNAVQMGSLSLGEVFEIFSTPIHMASEKGHMDIVQLLISGGANVDAVDHRSMTPLHWASWRGHFDIVKLLINNCANVNAVDFNAETPLHAATERGGLNIAQLLIARGANANVVDGDLWTPLHMASFSGHLEIAQILIANGANVNVVDDNSNTPLHKASQKGHFEIVQLLIANGANNEL